jgi:hypothetical protein
LDDIDKLEKNQLDSVGLSVALSRNLFAELGERWKLSRQPVNNKL